MKDMFGSMRDRIVYHDRDHTVFINLFGVVISTEDDIEWFERSLDNALGALIQEKGPLHAVVNYNGFDLKIGTEERFLKVVLDHGWFKSVRTFSGKAFKRAKLTEPLHLTKWDTNEIFDTFDLNKNGTLSMEEVRQGLIRVS